MSLSNEEKDTVEATLRESLRNKFSNYAPEPAAMPFHTRLLGVDRLALYSFIHSLNTNFGTSIFEPVAVALASSRFRTARSQVVAGNQISEAAQVVIQSIMDDLTIAAREPNKTAEIELIREACISGNSTRQVRPTRVDVWVENHNGGVVSF